MRGAPPQGTFPAGGVDLSLLGKAKNQNAQLMGALQQVTLEKMQLEGMIQQMSVVLTTCVMKANDEHSLTYTVADMEGADGKGLKVDQNPDGSVTVSVVDPPAPLQLKQPTEQSAE